MFTVNRADAVCAVVEFLPLRSNLATPPVSTPSNAQRARAGVWERKRVNQAGKVSSAGAKCDLGGDSRVVTCGARGMQCDGVNNSASPACDRGGRWASGASERA